MRRLLASTPPFSELDRRPVLDILRVDSASEITVGGAPAFRHEEWPRGDGPCAAAAVARALDEIHERVYVPSGFGDVVIDWDGLLGDARPMTSTAAAQKLFDGLIPDLEVSRRAATATRARLRALLP